MRALESRGDVRLAGAVVALIGALAVPGVALAAAGPGIGNIDCTDSERFKPLVFLENTQGGPTGANVVIMTGGYLMLNFANDSGGPPGILTFYDVSNPRQPKTMRRIDSTDTKQFRESHSFPVAIIGDKHYVAIQTIHGIQFWDVTDVATAAKVGNIDLPNVNAGDYENVAWQTSWQGRYLFVSGGTWACPSSTRGTRPAEAGQERVDGVDGRVPDRAHLRGRRLPHLYATWIRTARSACSTSARPNPPRCWRPRAACRACTRSSCRAIASTARDATATSRSIRGRTGPRSPR